MARVATDDRSNSKSKSKPQPYAPSWVNRFTAWVDRLPGSSWLYYLGLGLLEFMVLVIVLWIEGAFPIGALLPVLLFLPAMSTLLLALPHFLDNRAGAALTTLQPALKASEEEYIRLCYQLTTLPARPTLVASLAVPTYIFLLEAIGGRGSSIEALATWPISANLFYVLYLIGWWNFGAFLYHTIHQLGVINRIYTGHVRINLFRMRPLYAFSSVTALTAVSLAVPTYGWTALNPDNLSDPIAIGIAFLITVLALAAFAWPLLGVHRLLVEEKERLLGEISLRSETAMVELLQRIDEGKLEGMGDLSEAIVSLETEQNALKGIPTWPWQPETVRWLVTALVLPLALWIAQYVLQRLLGP